ncbi:hypothetical protein HPB51_026550 [Rhipicephalus microplus]|uniref:Uncharacterized protein n=1 Tax=Rhipicephalus microplus TaxID=6941 RepID=A0A9J6D2R1_RHIMP|nr:hypothetical protein HPB51_026550 [Rhipicephalus microplus]
MKEAAAVNTDGQSYRASKRKRSKRSKEQNAGHDSKVVPQSTTTAAPRENADACASPDNQGTAGPPVSHDYARRWCVLGAFSSQQGQECIEMEYVLLHVPSTRCGKIDATEKFFTRMKSLIAVMTVEALRPDSAGEKNIKKMLSFLDAWERHADKKKFLSESSAEGLRVTLTSTLELVRCLREKVGFRYLLTSRLSQDKVENLSGMVKLLSSCNSHPTPQQFLLTVSLFIILHTVLQARI